MQTNWIAWVLTNFAFVMFILAIIFIIVNRVVSRSKSAEIVYRWIALFALGVSGIYAFIMHALFPNLTAASIGWAVSPFQYEVAMANLAFGVLGIISFSASYGFRLATAIGATFWLWGDATGHIYQMVQFQNFAPGNAGSWFWMDILVPLILLICVFNLKPKSMFI